MSAAPSSLMQAQDEKSAPGSVRPAVTGDFHCPKCGTHQERGVECIKCGIIFAKYQPVETAVATAVEVEEEEDEPTKTGLMGRLINYCRHAMQRIAKMASRENRSAE